MKEYRTFYSADRSEWRAWLAGHYLNDEDIWFVFPTRASGEPSLSYNDAVEEALCFGWIDSTAGRLDDTHSLRRFSRRREGSEYSRPNIERLIWLNERDLLLPEVRRSVSELIAAPYVFPEDILDRLRSDQQLWENYCRFSAPYQRIRIAYIDAARDRPEEFEKRLSSFIAKTRAGKMIIGFGGIEKYYR